MSCPVRRCENESKGLQETGLPAKALDAPSATSTRSLAGTEASRLQQCRVGSESKVGPVADSSGICPDSGRGGSAVAGGSRKAIVYISIWWPWVTRRPGPGARRQIRDKRRNIHATLGTSRLLHSSYNALCLGRQTPHGYHVRHGHGHSTILK